jgi:hypothetical protein
LSPFVTDEAVEIIDEFTNLLLGPTGDGQVKRGRGKPFWKVDPGHADAMLRHLHRWDRGEKTDPDSGSHPLVHVAWRALAIAYQETQGDV